MWAHLEIDRTEPDENGRAHYRLSGSLSYGDPGARFVAEVKKDVDAGARTVIVDVEKVDRIDSGGIGLLCAAHSSVRNGGGVLRIEGLSPRYHKLFKTVGLSDVFDLRSEPPTG
ncbi:MAG: hypothetical protein DHS20C21_14320 [Gemmatimonadota bacterium]|nr:MAG: hypothetical protein DHS20C21_14320 [Gemmatimonadota bacterium]